MRPVTPSERSERGVGAPGRIRTHDPQIRSLVLYPAELPVLQGPPKLVRRAGNGKGSGAVDFGGFSAI